MPANPNAAKYFEKVKKPKNSEALLHKHICQWLKMSFPSLLFRSGLEGFKLSMLDAQYAKIINSHRGFPDLMIFRRRGSYVGLAIELKREGAPLYKKDGTLRKCEHLAEQEEILKNLADEGWATYFAQGFEDAKRKIEEYLTNGQRANS